MRDTYHLLTRGHVGQAARRPLVAPEVLADLTLVLGELNVEPSGARELVEQIAVSIGDGTCSHDQQSHSTRKGYFDSVMP